jgi:hypothetical protein
MKSLAGVMPFLATLPLQNGGADSPINYLNQKKNAP